MKPPITIAALATALITAAGATGADASERHYAGYDRPAAHQRLAIVNVRISNQYRRIRRSRRSGRLNWVEARKLRFELSHIRGFRTRYMRDGRISGWERRHLQSLLNQNSRRIRRMASNGAHGDTWRSDRNDYRDRTWRNYEGGSDRRRRGRYTHLNGFY